MFSAEKHARLVEQHRLEVTQLKREASIHRIKVIRVDIIFKPMGSSKDTQFKRLALNSAYLLDSLIYLGVNWWGGT